MRKENLKQNKNKRRESKRNWKKIKKNKQKYETNKKIKNIYIIAKLHEPEKNENQHLFK